VLGPSGDDQALFAAMDAMASAYVATSAPPAEIVAAIRHAAVAPGSFTSADLAQALARRRTGELLSPRERQVLALLMDGRSIAAIANSMHLSHSTAKTYTARLYEKLGAANRTQAVMAALRLGLVRHDSPVPPPRLPDVASPC
jgi:DNA-binding NarL/FixJ family response regulator